MSVDLKNLLQKIAKQEGRSFNSEIVQRVIKTLKDDGLIHPAYETAINSWAKVP
ncbi:Arc family DNA-binding protein [Xenorhabdus bovienii]|nr:Arc family DNA-binding protein [Xenorhabdus bovienii]MCG3470823.1 Arc family DNA-binding protein [Xenorhabdus bovienii]